MLGTPLYSFLKGKPDHVIPCWKPSNGFLLHLKSNPAFSLWPQSPSPSAPAHLSFCSTCALLGPAIPATFLFLGHTEFILAGSCFTLDSYASPVFPWPALSHHANFVCYLLGGVFSGFPVQSQPLSCDTPISSSAQHTDAFPAHLCSCLCLLEWTLHRLVLFTAQVPCPEQGCMIESLKKNIFNTFMGFPLILCGLILASLALV